jgi:hypothetical protein
LATIVVSNWPARSVSIDAGRLGVDTVDEEAAAADADEALAREVVAHVLLCEIFRQHDAVVDVDSVRVDRQRHGREIHDGAERVVHGLLGVEILGAECARDWIADGERRDVIREARDEVRRCRREILLLQRRRAEAGLGRAAQREDVGEVVARRDFAGNVAAEIRIVLGAQRDGAQ